MRTDSLSTREREALLAYIATLHNRFENQLVDVILFGSKARGDAHLDSDIDVLVLLDNPDIETLSEVRGLGFDILLTYGVFLSIRAMSRQQWQTLANTDNLFYHNLKQDGISLLPNLLVA